MDNRPPPLIDAIEDFLATHGMSPVTFGRKAMNDPHFVRDLRSGRRVWPNTEAKARDFMASATPADAPEARAA